MAAAQFCIRTDDPQFVPKLKETCGKPWSAALAELGHEILDISPHRVIRTAIGRAEIYSRIPPPGANSPRGPHTHLLPQYLAARLEMPPGAELPTAYAPAAMFYPTSKDGFSKTVMLNRS
jgi:hypothetical protein